MDGLTGAGGTGLARRDRRVALGAAIGALEGIGWPAVISHDRRIARSLRRGLAAIPGVRLRGPGTDTETLPVATFTVDGIPSALIAARLAAEDAIEVRHGCLHARPYLTRLLGLGPAGSTRQRGRARTGGRSPPPGAVRASAGINTSEGDVARLLRAVERLVSGEAPVRYRRDPLSGTSTQPGPRPSPSPSAPDHRTAPSKPTGPEVTTRWPSARDGRITPGRQEPPTSLAAIRPGGPASQSRS